MADGALPLGDLRVALCVPRSCRPAALEAALRSSLRTNSSLAVQVQVKVRPEHCHDEDEDDGHMSKASQLFWCAQYIIIELWCLLRQRCAV